MKLNIGKLTFFKLVDNTFIINFSNIIVPTMCFVRPAKAQIIGTVWSEPLQIFLQSQGPLEN